MKLFRQRHVIIISLLVMALVLGCKAKPAKEEKGRLELRASQTKVKASVIKKENKSGYLDLSVKTQEDKKAGFISLKFIKTGYLNNTVTAGPAFYNKTLKIKLLKISDFGLDSKEHQNLYKILANEIKLKIYYPDFLPSGLKIDSKASNEWLSLDKADANGFDLSYSAKNQLVDIKEGKILKSHAFFEEKPLVKKLKIGRYNVTKYISQKNITADLNVGQEVVARISFTGISSSEINKIIKEMTPFKENQIANPNI